MVSQVFLSYSRNDLAAAVLLRAELERSGLSVFKDDDSIREGVLWLERLQQALDASSAFVVLVGKDGVRRWIGAEAQVALSRYFGPHEDAERLPIFPILLGETKPETLPAFLRLFQATNWDGAALLPERLVEQIRLRQIAVDTSMTFEGCPFVGLAAYRMDQAQLFFGRQKETLDALACFFDVRPGNPSVRWLEINGSSGSGKSSLMQAGLLPLIEKGWLWQPRGRFDTWTRIGPMMPGEHPVEMLAESLSRSFDANMSESVRALQDGDDALRYWLRERKADNTAFLLAIDQFEELFTFADGDQRRQFDGLLAAALEDADCPLFVLSTVRSDFLDRFAEDLPRLVAVRNRLARPWTLGPMGADGLREVIDGPARLAGLDVSEVKEAMVAEARGEPGALPLVENALHWLWEKDRQRLSGKLFSEQGGLAGILSSSADDLLADLEPRQRDRALELLFRMVLIEPQGRRHTRRRIPLTEAIAIAGGGKHGRDLVDRLAGRRRLDTGARDGPLRLITVSEDLGEGATAARQDRWVNLIHETLIRSKGPGAGGKAEPYWPRLWTYIETNKERAARRERLQLMAREWKDRTGLSRLFGLAGWSSFFGFWGLAAPGRLEQRYLRWSRARALVEIVLLAAIASVIGESVYWARVKHDLPYQALEARWAHFLGKELPLPSFGHEIPAGSFSRGSESGESNERPVRRVTLARPFFIAKTEVSFAQYDLFCGATGREKPSDSGWGRDDWPAINVTWTDAQAYAGWLGAMTGRACRLPSEAEWEYAARAGTKKQYALPEPDGSDDIRRKGLANCAGCGREGDRYQTAPVDDGFFPANAWGLRQMHGNVFEWVEDCWHDSYEGAPDDGSAWQEANGGDCGFHVLRGGSWDYGPVGARSSFRFRRYLSNRSSNIGFRVVCSSPSAGH